MIERNVKIPKKENPVLLDKVIQDIQETLAEKLEWLNYAFGRAYKLVEHNNDGSKFIYPAAYVGNSEYVSLLPNDNFGNFSWFDLYDPQEITNNVQTLPQFTFSGAIIFWFNLNSIFADADAMYVEEVKDEIARVLTSSGFIKNGRLTLLKICERFENIYKGYALEKVYNNYTYKGEGIQSIDKQFFMHPYAGLRFEFNMVVREMCMTREDTTHDMFITSDNDMFITSDNKNFKVIKL